MKPLIMPGSRQATKDDLEWVLGLLGIQMRLAFPDGKQTVQELRELVAEEFRKIHASLETLYGRNGQGIGDNLARLRALHLVAAGLDPQELRSRATA